MEINYKRRKVLASAHLETQLQTLNVMICLHECRAAGLASNQRKAATISDLAAIVRLLELVLKVAFAKKFLNMDKTRLRPRLTVLLLSLVSRTTICHLAHLRCHSLGPRLAQREGWSFRMNDNKMRQNDLALMLQIHSHAVKW